MKKLSPLVLIVILCACSTPTQVTNFWKTNQPVNKSYHTIFVAALVNSVNVKGSIENNVAAAAAAKGLKAVKSGEVFPPNFTKENLPDKSVMLEKLRQLGCDAIYTVTLVRREEESRYVPGSGPYVPYPRYGWYGSFWGYYNYWSPMMYNPGYYTTDKTYYMETNLYDADSEALLFSVQSATFNPNSVDDFSKSYTKAIVHELTAQGLLK